MKFENGKNFIECFDDIFKVLKRNICCLKHYGEDCPASDCVICKYSIRLSDRMTYMEKKTFVISILKKNKSCPNNCGTCLTSPCMHSCTDYLIRKHKINL